MTVFVTFDTEKSLEDFVITCKILGKSWELFSHPDTCYFVWCTQFS